MVITIAKEKVVQTVEKTIETFCNNCGKCCTKYTKDYKGEKFSVGDYCLDVKYSGGYWSKYLDDITTYKFSLCEKCLFKIINKLMIPADIECYGYNESRRNSF